MKILTCFLLAVAVANAAPSRFTVADSLEIAKVPADFRVGFSLLTTSERQYATYHDAERRMTVASRALDANEWTYQTLPSKVGWDSHNYVTMAVDAAGHLHVSGNMHVDPLVYFCTTEPGDIGTSPTPGIRYLLQWESLGSNHDRPRKPPLPEPSTLRLYQLNETDDQPL